MPDIEINGEVIRPGESRSLELFIARLPSGTQITMPVHIFRSEEEGPTILLTGGMHGDEVNGIEIIRRFLDAKTSGKLLKGSIIAIPIINVYGFINFSRDVPDGKDVNRSFPGKPEGSLASNVAHTISSKILPQVDFGIDFHTGGASRTNWPQVRFEKDNALGQEIAEAFNAPFSLSTALIKGSFREVAAEMGKTIVVFEGGETLRIDPRSVECAIHGISKVLHHFGMLEKFLKPKRSIHFDQSQWVRAEVSGLFRYKRESGKKVKEGQTIGYISSPTNEYSVKVKSPVNGYIIGHNNFPLIHKGDALFHIGSMLQTEDKTA